MVAGAFVVPIYCVNELKQRVLHLPPKKLALIKTRSRLEPVKTTLLQGQEPEKD